MKPAPPDRLSARGLSLLDSAGYVGVCPNTFNKMVADELMPPPKRVGRRKIWDRRELDAAFEALPVDGENKANDWDKDAA